MFSIMVSSLKLYELLKALLLQNWLYPWEWCSQRHSQVFNQRILILINIKNCTCLMLGKFFWTSVDHKQCASKKQKHIRTCE
jgi:hypothetical protein